MVIRKAIPNDLEDMKELFVCARKYMKENGNPTQWKDNRPDINLVIKDIQNDNSYVILHDGEIVGTFACIRGIEPTYLDIDGKWLNDDEYVTIHRIASNGKCKGIFDEMMNYVDNMNLDIRIDTHKDNKIMQHLIDKHGFEYCGIIIVDDGTERLAYQKVCAKY